MKDKLRGSIHRAKEEGIPPEILNYTSSVVDPEITEELSDKISSMLPDMGIIKCTGIIKNTESFKESKQILDNFKTSLQNSRDGVFEQYKKDYSYQKPDGRSALEQASDGLHKIVKCMLKAGIEVPTIYKDFIHAIRPPVANPNEVQILNKPPLFKITGIDENGEVKVETDTSLVLKKGETEIALTQEKLTNTLINSQKTDIKVVKYTHDWVKENLYRAGSLEKISDEEWSKLRKKITDRFNERDKVMEYVKNLSNKNVESDDIEGLIQELENESLENSKTGETKVKIEIPPSTNKNAYEIRLQVLQEALNWVKHNKNTNKVEDVLDVANKLYKFVEQRR